MYESWEKILESGLCRCNWSKTREGDMFTLSYLLCTCNSQTISVLHEQVMSRWVFNGYLFGVAHVFLGYEIRN